MVDINTIKLNLTTTYFLDITIDPSIYLLIKIKILKNYLYWRIIIRILI